MSIKITSRIDIGEILRSRGVGASKKLQRYLAARVKMHCDPYVPMQQGMLKGNVQIAQDGSSITYNSPYAHYQYHGMVMGPNVLTKKGWRSMAKKGGKYYTGKPLTYRGAPMRGRYWDKRMLADKKGVIERELAAYMGGQQK